MNTYKGREKYQLEPNEIEFYKHPKHSSNTSQNDKIYNFDKCNSYGSLKKYGESKLCSYKNKGNSRNIFTGVL